MSTSTDSSQPVSAEQHFRAAFERLKLGIPEVLSKGTLVSQNNVAKEAGCDPSALRKSRFPLLVFEIQEWVRAHKGERPFSERQKMLKQRRKNRSARNAIEDLRRQRDVVAGLLSDANLRIVELSEKLADVELRLKEYQPSARVLDLPKKDCESSS